jgi:hypothetical protein
MNEGRFQPFFYAGITKFIGIGLTLIMSLVFSLVNYYGTIGYPDYLIYTATAESLRYLIDIAFFILISVSFSRIYNETMKSEEERNISIYSLVYSIFLFINIILVILLFSLGTLVNAYISGAFYMLTAFPAFYVCFILFKYFKQKYDDTYLKIINYSFIVLGSALFFHFLFVGLGLVIPIEVGLAFNALSGTASGITYAVFVIVATGMIIYSKKNTTTSRVTEFSP